MRIPGASVQVIALATAVGFGALPHGAEAARKSRPIVPDEFRAALSLEVEGVARSYWSFDSAGPVVFTVRGPGEVKLITRLALGAAAEGSYEIAVREEGNEVARRGFQVLPAEGVVGEGSARWGRHRNLTFDVPAGRHTYHVARADRGSAAVAARPRFLPPSRARSRVSITPTQYERVLLLVRSEKEITYYRVRPEVPMEVTVVGPTELQVNTRLDFDQRMKGSIHCYGVEIREDGETVAQASFDVSRSQVASYSNGLKVTPGVVKSLRVPLGEGVHTLEIWLKDTVAPGAGVKLYLPAKDVRRPTVSG